MATELKCEWWSDKGANVVVLSFESLFYCKLTQKRAKRAAASTGLSTKQADELYRRAMQVRSVFARRPTPIEMDDYSSHFAAE